MKYSVSKEHNKISNLLRVTKIVITEVKIGPNPCQLRVLYFKIELIWPFHANQQPISENITCFRCKCVCVLDVVFSFTLSTYPKWEIWLKHKKTDIIVNSKFLFCFKWPQKQQWPRNQRDCFEHMTSGLIMLWLQVQCTK